MTLLEMMMGNKYLLIAAIVLSVMIFIKTIHILFKLSIFALFAIVIIIWLRTL
jgi:hypothetical protein